MVWCPEELRYCPTSQGHIPEKNQNDRHHLSPEFSYSFDWANQKFLSSWKLIFNTKSATTAAPRWSLQRQAIIRHNFCKPSFLAHNNHWKMTFTDCTENTHLLPRNNAKDTFPQVRFTTFFCNHFPLTLKTGSSTTPKWISIFRLTYLTFKPWGFLKAVHKKLSKLFCPQRAYKLKKKNDL